MKKTSVTPYLNFAGRCEEAIAFYTKAVGAAVEMVMHFSDSPEPLPPGSLQPGFEKKVMHSSFRIGESTVMATDGCNDKDKFSGFSLALTVATEAEADAAFAALGVDGKVTMPLMKTFWSPKYGMLADKFGVEWMVMVQPSSPGCP